MHEIPRWPVADKMDEEALRHALYSDSWWRNTGTQVKKFEKEFAEYQDCKGGISVANGTVALEIALKALGIGENDEVIVPDFTFYSTVSSILSIKAVPVIVDVDKDTYCMDPSQMEAAVTKRTKAVITVHIAGNISMIDKVCEVAKKYKLFVIEDCAHAHGAVWKGKKAGSFGTLSTFSFQNAKLLTAGEGGIVLTSDEALIDRLLLEANCGRKETDVAYQHVLIGTNARLSELQGALLRSQLRKYNEQRNLRVRNYIYLKGCMDQIPGIRMQNLDDNLEYPSHYMIMFKCEKGAFRGATRDSFVAYLKKRGIPANRSYESIHRLPVFKTLPKGTWRATSECVNSINISDNVICLAHNILLGDHDLLDWICDVIKSFYKFENN